MEKCTAILKSGARDGEECGAKKKYVINGNPQCGRHVTATGVFKLVKMNTLNKYSLNNGI